MRSGVSVDSLGSVDGCFSVGTSAGTLTAESVVIATGANTTPSRPDFAAELDAEIHQLHAGEYRSPSSVAPGPVLVVGAGASGVEIALELAASHPTYLAGRPTPHIPAAVFTLAGGAYWAFVNGVLTTSTPIGRRASSTFHARGGPLIGTSMKEVVGAGVIPLPRLTGVQGGLPVADGAVVPPPKTVIWATGYRPDLGWIDGLERDRYGLPVTDRGVVESAPGLYFVGMPFQYGLTSGLIGGVGRDADYVAGRIAEQRRRALAIGE
ncbi:hypothetical protein GCM10025865_30230 [Paraoerskovia sediminicola]|uniref:Flavoprotein involved in K+ transport n=1 Tax=Paraoerskovia sediminicola TaxID=1138587 RepID=A0ABN6XFU4_9CELL|nr:hypothetical protein GCM10025865_30230 [Paraoerskovia sediminicola]